MASEKSITLRREEPEISSSIMNSKAQFLFSCVTHIMLARSTVAPSIHVVMILYIGLLNA